MIRRDFNTQPGNPQWLLISQMEHARLSGELAEHWGQSPFLSLVCKEQLLPAIYHHDDGWSAWQQAPEVDARTGRPLSFTEMPLGESLEIWSRSIETGVSIGPLAAWSIAGHFVTLLSQAEEAPQPAAKAWMADCEAQRAIWLEEWTASAEDRTLERARLALAQLKLFDWLSLWLCMAERTAPQEFEIPGGPKLTLTPLPRQQSDEAQRIQMSPWPLSMPLLSLEVTGKLIPVKTYPTNGALQSALTSDLGLSWRLVSEGE